MNIHADIVFKIVNFILMCIGGIYLFHRYGILYIVSAMRLNRQKKDKQQLRHDTLLQEYDGINQRSQEQEIVFHAFQKKIELWNAKELQHNNLQKELYLRYEGKAAENQVIKFENMQQKQLLQKELPLILQEISEHIRDDFANNADKQKAYTDKLVTFLSERIS